MSIIKVIEVLSNSETSWQDATRKAVGQAEKSLKTFVLHMCKTKVPL